MFVALKPTGVLLAESQQAALDLLLSRPAGMDRTTAVALSKLETITTRFGELRALGLNLPKAVHNGKAWYQLRTPHWGSGDEVDLGVKARAGATSGLVVSLYAECRGVLKPEVEARLLRRIREAMEEALATLDEQGATDTPDEIDLFDENTSVDEFLAAMAAMGGAR